MEGSGFTSSSTAGSGVTASAYETLLRRVSDLQGDLGAAMAAASALKAHNDTLSDKYERVRCTRLCCPMKRAVSCPHSAPTHPPPT